MLISDRTQDFNDQRRENTDHRLCVEERTCENSVQKHLVRCDDMIEVFCLLHLLYKFVPRTLQHLTNQISHYKSTNQSDAC